MKLIQIAAALVLLAKGAEAQIPTDGLLSHWAFDEDSGTNAVDQGPAANNGFIWQAQRIGNAPSIGAPNISCLQFDGVDDLIGVSDTSCGTASVDFTVAFWVYPTAAQSISPIVSPSFESMSGKRFAIAPANGGDLYGSNHSAIGVSVGSNGVSVYDRVDDGVWPLLVHEASLSSWTHVAVVVTGNVPVLFLNGVQVKVGSACPRTLHPSAKMGGNTGFGVGLYQGSLDDVRIYTRSLSGAEVNSLGFIPAITTPPTPSPGTTPGAGVTDSSSGGSTCSAAPGTASLAFVILAVAAALGRLGR